MNNFGQLKKDMDVPCTPALKSLVEDHSKTQGTEDNPVAQVDGQVSLQVEQVLGDVVKLRVRGVDELVTAPRLMVEMAMHTSQPPEEAAA